MRQQFARFLPAGLAATTVLACASAAVAASRLPHRSAQARFVTPAAYRQDARAARAITYDRAEVPVGGWVRVTQAVNKWGGMDVRLQVRDMPPDRRYRAEVHVDGCGARPSSAGPAFKNGPSAHDYAANEFWLNFHTDGSGDATTLTRQYWGIGKHQHAGSVVIHVPGSATTVAACVSVPFKRIWGW